MKCKKPSFLFPVSVFINVHPGLPSSAAGEETALGYRVVPVLRFLPFPLSESDRKKCVYTRLDYSLLPGNGESVVGEERERERALTVTLNEILFSGTTQLENIRARQKLHVCVRACVHACAHTRHAKQTRV